MEKEPRIDTAIQKNHGDWIGFCIQMIQKFIAIQGNSNQVSDTTETKAENSKESEKEIVDDSLSLKLVDEISELSKL